jgi:DNA-binding response OmpR family regulator
VTAVSQSRKKVLVIDDDASMLALVKRQLENAGMPSWSPRTASSATSTRIRSGDAFNARRLDIPYLSGYELVEALKANRLLGTFLWSLRAEAYTKKPLKVDQLLRVMALFTSGPA